MYAPYGIHKREWNKYKHSVMKNNLDSIDIKKEFGLDDRQIWFLFDKLLQCKYDHLYKRSNMNKEDIKIGQYVYCQDLEYGRGKIVKIFDNDLMSVKFDNRKHETMCSQSGYTVHDDIKRKVTKL